MKEKTYEYYCQKCGKSGKVDGDTPFLCEECGHYIYPYPEGEKDIYKYYCEECGEEGIMHQNDKASCPICFSSVNIRHKGQYEFVNYYCKQCGKVGNIHCDQELSCEFCGTWVYILPMDIKYTPVVINNFEGKKRIREELIGDSPEINRKYYKEREKQESMELLEEECDDEYEITTTFTNLGIRCPYCNSFNVRKITATKKALNSIFWGIFSIGMNMNNFHCDNCEADF